MKKLCLLLLLSSAALFAQEPQKGGIHDYDLFRAVQKIRMRAQQGMVKKNESVSMANDNDDPFLPWPYNFQTKGGLRLLTNQEIWTPWGQVRLLVNGDKDELRQCCDLQQLSQKIKTRFVRTMSLGYSEVRPKFLLLCAAINLDEHKTLDSALTSGVVKEVSEQYLKKLTGQSALVLNRKAGFEPVYVVDEVDGLKLEAGKELDYSEYKNHVVVKAAWDALMVRYQQEERELV